MFLSDDHEIGLMSQKREHNQISICTIEAMTGIGIVVRVRFCLSDVIHHLVLTLSWDRGI